MVRRKTVGKKKKKKGSEVMVMVKADNTPKMPTGTERNKNLYNDVRSPTLARNNVMCRRTKGRPNQPQ